MPITSHIFHILPPEPPFPEAFAEVGRSPGRRTSDASNQPLAAVPSTIRCHSTSDRFDGSPEIRQVRPDWAKQPEIGLLFPVDHRVPQGPATICCQFASSKTTREARRRASDAIPSTGLNFLGRTNCFDGWKRSYSSTPDPEGRPLVRAACSGSPMRAKKLSIPLAYRPLLSKPTPRAADRIWQS